MPEASPGRCGQRDRFVTGPGPDAGGSNQGKDGWFHIPEKSGIGASPFVVPLVVRIAGVAVCAEAGVAAAVANATHTSKFRFLFMPICPSRFS